MIGPDGFGRLVLAEWTKFRTVRGWTIGLAVAMLLTGLFGLLPSDSCSNADNTPCAAAPTGPDGEAVTDRFYFVHQPLSGNGGITVRLTSLTGEYTTHPVDVPGQPASFTPGVEAWSKGGVLITASLRPGSAYAAMLATGGHGVRMQYDYTHDTAGLPGTASPTSPRWLRLVRSGDTITGYDSADGRQWTLVGTAVLAGLPTTVQIGMFATSPGHSVVTQSIAASAVRGGPSLAIATMDHVDVPGAWTGDTVSDGQSGPRGLSGGYQQNGDTFTVRGSGDIAPDVPGGRGVGVAITQPLIGTFFGLIAVAMVGAMFVAAEYRRGLIRTTFVANPRRGQMLAAKAVVLGAVTFVSGLVAAGFALVFGVARLRGQVPVDPVSVGTEIRIVVGTALLLAVAAVLALALGAVLRRGTGAVAAVIVVIVLPYLLGELPTVLPANVQEWLLRITPAAAFALQQAYPRYPQIDAQYTLIGGYYPLPPWGGFAVLCGYAALAVGLATVLLRRRDA